MKIQSNGFRVTDICPQVDKIEVDGEGMIRVTFRAEGTVVPQRSACMSVDEFADFADAAKVVLERLSGSEGVTVERPLRIADKHGDTWNWHEGHDRYVLGDLCMHETCGSDEGCGCSLEHIKRYYGPIKILD